MGVSVGTELSPIQTLLSVLFEESEKSSSQAINTLKQVYRVCMDTEALARTKSAALLERLEQFGGWPVIHGNK